MFEYVIEELKKLIKKNQNKIDRMMGHMIFSPNSHINISTYEAKEKLIRMNKEIQSAIKRLEEKK